MAKTIHGKFGTRVYKAWTGMIGRCHSPNDSSYRNYGGRGITVCERWRVFVNFYADMGEPPAGMSLDRVDVNGNYEPSNCRWATARQQANNMRTNHRICFNGETLTLTQWSRRTGLGVTTIRERFRRGWSIEQALSAAATGPQIKRPDLRIAADAWKVRVVDPLLPITNFDARRGNTCRRGHELTDSNVYVVNEAGRRAPVRRCKKCHLARIARRKLAKAAG